MNPETTHEVSPVGILGLLFFGFLIWLLRKKPEKTECGYPDNPAYSEHVPAQVVKQAHQVQFAPSQVKHSAQSAPYKQAQDHSQIIVDLFRRGYCAQEIWQITGYSIPDVIGTLEHAGMLKPKKAYPPVDYIPQGRHGRHTEYYR